MRLARLAPCAARPAAGSGRSHGGVNRSGNVGSKWFRIPKTLVFSEPQHFPCGRPDEVSGPTSAVVRLVRVKPRGKFRYRHPVIERDFFAGGQGGQGWFGCGRAWVEPLGQNWRRRWTSWAIGRLSSRRAAACGGSTPVASANNRRLQNPRWAGSSEFHLHRGHARATRAAAYQARILLIRNTPVVCESGAAADPAVSATSGFVPCSVAPARARSML